MILKYFYDKQLAQASYLLGCAKTGEALVIDPNRDVDFYMKAAQQEGLRVTHVAETHIHADYVSGSMELAAATGAELYLSNHGMGKLNYNLAELSLSVMPVVDGDRWKVGNILVEVTQGSFKHCFSVF